MADRAGLGRRLGRRERAMVIIAAAVVLLAGVAFLLTRGGEEEAFVVPTIPPRPRPALTPTPSPTETPFPETFEVFEGKDPFQPVIVAPAPAPSPGESPAPTGPTGRTEEGRRVTLVDIFTEDGVRMAVVQVGGEEFTVEEGDTFADNFKVLDLTERCGTFLHGDERFTLCIGQEVIK